MSRVLTYNEIDQKQWNALVRDSATGTWFQTPEAYAFFASMPNLFRPFVVGVEKEPTSDSSLKGRESFASVWGAHTADSTQYDLLKENACANRKKPTEAESILWGMLKGNNLGLHFRRQHIILDYIVDFICLEKGLIIELDGGYHTNPQQKEYDEQRTAHLQRLGYTELRFTNEELLGDPESVVAKIKARATQLPSFQGGEVLGLSTSNGRSSGERDSDHRIDGDRPLLRAICVGYATKEKSAIKQYFTRRAIIIGGPVIANNATEEEVIALMTAIREQPILNPSLKGRTSNHPSLQGRDGKRLLSPIYIETRNLNDYSRWKEAFEKAGFDYIPHLNFHVHTDRPWTEIEEQIGKHRRKYIRLSLREGATIETQPEIEQVKAYYALLQNLYRTKVKTPLLPWSFFERLYHLDSCRYMLVVYNGQVVGGSVCMVLPGKGVYEWYACGMDGEYKNLYPSSVTKYAGMRYACDTNCAVFDMMGAGKPDEEYGVRDFKAEFGGEKVEHGRFVCVNKPLLYWFGKLGVKLLRKANN